MNLRIPVNPFWRNVTKTNSLPGSGRIILPKVHGLTVRSLKMVPFNDGIDL
jgi:hypothetical protein